MKQKLGLRTMTTTKKVSKSMMSSRKTMLRSSRQPRVKIKTRRATPTSKTTLLSPFKKMRVLPMRTLARTVKMR